MEKSKVLILGSAGMLGQALGEEFEKKDEYLVTGWDREDIDLTNFLDLEKALNEVKPAIVINAAAYNAVDKCEEDEEEFEKAVALNGKLPEALAHLSNELQFLLIHYSTDYIFDGEKKSGYREGDEPNPISKYGMSKYLGEKAVQENTKNFYLIRLSKLFGKPGISSVAKKSFFETILAKAKENPSTPLRVVQGETSCFTYAPDLAQATRSLIEDRVPMGIYHLPNEGGATWYEGARELFRQAQLKVEIEPVPPETFARPAKRPANSILENTKRPKLRPYEEALADFLAQMVQ